MPILPHGVACPVQVHTRLGQPDVSVLAGTQFLSCWVTWQQSKSGAGHLPAKGAGGGWLGYPSLAGYLQQTTLYTAGMAL